MKHTVEIDDAQIKAIRSAKARSTQVNRASKLRRSGLRDPEADLADRDLLDTMQKLVDAVLEQVPE